MRETIVGRFDWSGQTVDTLQGTGQWNVVLEVDDRLYIRACHIRSDSLDGQILFLRKLETAKGQWAETAHLLTV